MSQARVDLLVARFLDAPAARALPGVSASERRRGALLVVESCLRELGAEPRELDGDGARALLLDVLARKVGTKDPLVPHLPALVRAFFAHLGDEEMVTHAYEIDRALDEVDDAAFARAVRSVAPGERIASPGRTVRGRGDKVGRNDPCPCGSGRKFKQCCAKLGGP